jgi:hypothetical protein
VRTGTYRIEEEDAEYMLCFSAAVSIACEEKYGTYQEVPIKTLADTTWFLHQMMLAGYEYAQLKGIEAKKPPTYKNLLAVTDIADLPKINAAIVNTLNRGLKRNVELEQPKNVEATLPENEEQSGM